MPRSRSIVALTLVAALVPLPGYAAPAPQPAPTAAPAPTSTTSTPAPTTGTTGSVAPTTGTAPAAPADAGAAPTDAPVDAVPAEGEAPVDAVPVEEAAAPEEPPPPETPAVPEGPERPPEPTLGNGKYKAKGTGLMISGGILFGLGAIGVITSVFLTRCEDLDNSFACKNRQHNTFAVPATATVTLLGAVLLAVGLTYRARYKRWERWSPGGAKTAFKPVITSGGIGVRF